ncbi:hypothetical protein FS837_005525 [Tulasnella sp. UAMH 9824]|nr:hypothetical protein FS837_005525 [Tulasnella sp. UAMH 9824]
MDYMSQLPIELLIFIILLSLEPLDNTRRLIRPEQLRLVSGAWKATIDSTPPFWTYITGELPRSYPERIQGWIQKSGEAPLHIHFKRHTASLETLNRSLEAFMPLVTPHIHRWRKLELQGWSYKTSISTYINEPAPMLESLALSFVLLSASDLTFGGITPSLSSVELGHVGFSLHPTFLQNLENLVLRNITDSEEKNLPLSRLRNVLNACPDLQRLEIDGRYVAEPSLAREPILLAKLSFFSFSGLQNPPDTTEAIFGMIAAPHLPLTKLTFDEHWAWRTMNILSPLSTKLLLRYTKFRIYIFNWRIQILPITEEGEVPSTPTVIANLSSSARMGGPALKILDDVGNAIPLSAAVDIVVNDPRSTRLISSYLRSTIAGNDTSFGHPLPQLRTFQMNVGFQENRPYEAEQLLSELAQGRQDIPHIRIRIRKGAGYDEFDTLQWDRATSSFV